MKKTLALLLSLLLIIYCLPAAAEGLYIPGSKVALGQSQAVVRLTSPLPIDAANVFPNVMFTTPGTVAGIDGVRILYRFSGGRLVEVMWSLPVRDNMEASLADYNAVRDLISAEYGAPMTITEGLFSDQVVSVLADGVSMMYASLDPDFARLKSFNEWLVSVSGGSVKVEAVQVRHGAGDHDTNWVVLVGFYLMD